MVRTTARGSSLAYFNFALALCIYSMSSWVIPWLKIPKISKMGWGMVVSPQPGGWNLMNDGCQSLKTVPPELRYLCYVRLYPFHELVGDSMAQNPKNLENSMGNGRISTPRGLEPPKRWF